VDPPVAPPPVPPALDPPVPLDPLLEPQASTRAAASIQQGFMAFQGSPIATH
jgi:hypothetical protein